MSADPWLPPQLDVYFLAHLFKDAPLTQQRRSHSHICRTENQKLTTFITLFSTVKAAPLFVAKT